MGLLKPHNIESKGVSLPDAYHRVITIISDYEQNAGTVVVGVYASKEAREEGKEPVERITLTLTDQKVQGEPDPETGETELVDKNEFTDTFAPTKLQKKDPVKASYEYVKALPEYKNAIDDLS